MRRTFEMLARGEAVGVFQVESQGMRRALVDMHPDRFEDLVVLVALYRPGPMANIPTYCARKLGKEPVDYLHPALKPILEPTYGVITYQEQVMQIARDLAGYSLGEADLLRRAMGKKIRKEMEAQRARFMRGAEEHGIAKPDAREIFEALAKFADYGFNKSHSAPYALITYQTAYMKAHYPAEFLAASMTLDTNNTDKVAEFRREAIRLGIVVEPPSVNTSGVKFDVKDGRILYALSAIKGVGEQAVEHIVELRNERPFTDLADFASRLNPRFLNKRALESLIAAGALDALDARPRAPDGGRRPHSRHRLTRRPPAPPKGRANCSAGPANASRCCCRSPIRGLPAERLQKEHAAIGFYLVGASAGRIPADTRSAARAGLGAILRGGANAAGSPPDALPARSRRSRSGGRNPANRMGIVQLSDPTGSYEAILFSETLNEFRDLLEPGQSVVVMVGAEDRPRASASASTRSSRSTAR